MTSKKIPFEQQIVILQNTITTMVRQDKPDLSARQLAVFLICYLNETVQTVRGLAAALRVSGKCYYITETIWGNHNEK